MKIHDSRPHSTNDLTACFTFKTSLPWFLKSRTLTQPSFKTFVIEMWNISHLIYCVAFFDAPERSDPGRRQMVWEWKSMYQFCKSWIHFWNSRVNIMTKNKISYTTSLEQKDSVILIDVLCYSYVWRHNWDYVLRFLRWYCRTRNKQYRVWVFHWNQNAFPNIGIGRGGGGAG